MRMLLRGGGSYPLWFSDLAGLYSVATMAFDPFATYNASAKTASDESDLRKYVKNGFGVKNATDASVDIYVITWEQYQDYLTTHKETPYDDTLIHTITARQVQLGAGEWCLTPVVKVYAANDGDYSPLAGATYIQVGIIL